MEAFRSCALAAFLGSSGYPDLQFYNQDSSRWKLAKEVAGWEAPSLGIPGFRDLLLNKPVINCLEIPCTAYISVRRTSLLRSKVWGFRVLDLKVWVHDHSCLRTCKDPSFLVGALKIAY